MTMDSDPQPPDPDAFLELPPQVDAVLTRPAKSRRRALAETILRWTMRVILAGWFLYAGILKILDPIRFAEDIRNYQLVQDPVPAAVALTLPWLEVFAALGVLTGILYRGSLVTIGGMLLVFIAAIASAWSRGLDISCGCFGGASGSTTNYPLHLAENAVLCGMCLVLLLYSWRRDRRRLIASAPSA
jgi:putative oxidoreductase